MLPAETTALMLQRWERFWNLCPELRIQGSYFSKRKLTLWKITSLQKWHTLLPL